jgi:hypothetical protein
MSRAARLALGRIAVRREHDLGAQRLDASDGGVEIIDLEPQEHTIAPRRIGGITEVAVMVFFVPAVELHDQLIVGNKALVLTAAVTALAAKELLVPPAAGLDVANRDQWLWSH